MSSRNVSHILTMLQRKDMPCQCQYISTFMAICYKPIFFMSIYTGFGFEGSFTLSVKEYETVKT